MLFSAVCTILLSSFAAAQNYGPPAGPAQPTTAAAPAAAPIPSAPADTAGHVNVNVAFNGGFTFNPANITASNGTAVTFWFPASSIQHSVTQSSFANPCTYLAATSNTSAGFDSGLTASTQFTIVIDDDTKPIWYHCKQVTHCGSFGMVGSINAPTSGSNTFEAFQAAAMKIGSSEVTETDNGPVVGGSIGVNAVASESPSNTGSGAAPSNTNTSSGMKIQISAGTVLLGFAAIVAFA